MKAATFEEEFYRLLGAIRIAHEGVMHLLDDKTHVNGRSAQLQKADGIVHELRVQLADLKQVWSRVP